MTSNQCLIVLSDMGWKERHSLTLNSTCLLRYIIRVNFAFRVMDEVTTLKRSPEIDSHESTCPPEVKVKRVKEEEKNAEKMRKMEEKERKAKERQAEKERKQQERQVEKEQKEAEKRKKEASQSRINRWFLSRPTNPEPLRDEENLDETPSKSNYQRLFLKYEPKHSARLWPTSAEEQSPPDSLEWLVSLRPNAPDSRWLSTNAFSQAISRPHCDSSELTSLLDRIRPRHLQFSENTRPPFMGTVVELSLSDQRLLAKYPWERKCDFLDYGYDSENEWTAEDGEDLGDEDEDEAGEDMSDDDSLNDFVAADGDDGDIVGSQNEALKPIIIWSTPGEPIPEELSAWRIEFLQPVTNKHLVKSLDAEVEPSPLDPYKVSIDPNDLRQILRRIQNSSDSKVYWKETLAKEFTSIPKSKLEVVFKNFAEREGRLGPWRIKPEASSQLGI